LALSTNYSFNLSSVVDRVFDSGRVKLDNKTSIFCYSAKHAALRCNSKDLFAHNKGIVFE